MNRIMSFEDMCFWVVPENMEFSWCQLCCHWGRRRCHHDNLWPVWCYQWWRSWCHGDLMIVKFSVIFSTLLVVMGVSLLCYGCHNCKLVNIYGSLSRVRHDEWHSRKLWYNQHDIMEFQLSDKKVDIGEWVKASTEWLLICKRVCRHFQM